MSRMPTISRRAALAGAAAAVAAGTAPRFARADLPAIHAGVIPIWDVAPYYAADQQGYFAAENLATTIQILRGGAAMLPALLSGSLDIGYVNGTSIVEAVVRGVDLRIAMEGAPIPKTPPDPGALLKRKTSALRTGKDVEGKVIAVTALRDIQWMFVMAWVKATGGDPEKVQIVEVPIPTMVAALKENRVDAALVLDPFMTLGLADPAIDVLDWPLSKVYPDGPVGMWTITPQTAAQRPNDVRAFVRAYKRGVAWVNANAGKEPVVQLIAGYTGLSPDLVRKMKLTPAHAEIVPNGLAHLTALMTQTGLLATSVDLRTKIFT